jgi:GTP-binding protein TypA/BipA
MTDINKIRNLAIIAHVDHGKTTLVDAMLGQSGAFKEHREAETRVMDSMDIEKERGITILAKNTSVQHDGYQINIVDTPGHADFGGEVERALTMVDGAVLLVDSSEGPLPQTRFVLSKALAKGIPIVVVINKIDRPDARIPEVLDEIYELFMDISTSDHQIEFPVLYTNAKAGTSTEDLAVEGKDLTALFDKLIEYLPAPEGDATKPLQAWVTNLDSSKFVGRLAICKVINGTIRKGQSVAWCKKDGTVKNSKIAVMYGTKNHERVEIEEASAGELIAVAGMDEITIGETIADVENPVALPLIDVDHPNISMTIGINTSPLAGREGDRLTARMLKDRLTEELIGNVSIKVLPTERPDTWEVHGRGELQLAILIETMRREGFELTVGKPHVVTREIDGVKNEPIERLFVEIPEEHMGAISQLLAGRKGLMEGMHNHADGWVRLDYLIPARGLIGFRTDFLTESRGTGILHHTFEKWEPWVGEIKSRQNGSLVADRQGSTTGFAILNLQERSTIFLPPGVQVYEGMIVGENSRAEDMSVNITKEKKLTNMRASGSDNTEKISAPIELSLDRALEFIAEDECVEVTPKSIRLRKAKA